MTTTEPPRALHFVPGLRFSCTGCGKCCNSDWALPVTEKKATSLEKTELFQRKVRQGYEPLKVVDETIILGTRENGGCVFLDGPLCEIHRDIGAEEKPLTCQLFPLNLVSTPDGIHVSLSFACPAVISGVGPPIDERWEWLSGFLAMEDDNPPMSEVGETVLIAKEQEWSYADYLVLEAKLLEAIDDSLCPEGVLNWACQLLEDGPTLGAAGFSVEKTSSLLGQAVSLLDIFGRTVIGIMELDTSPEEREQFINGLAEESQSRSVKTGAHFPSFSYYRPPSEMARNLLIKFMKSQIQGKRLLTGETVVSRLLAFGTAIAVVCYYLEAQARESGSLHFSFEHLERAFTLVEENLLTHSQDLRAFLSAVRRRADSDDR